MERDRDILPLSMNEEGDFIEEILYCLSRGRNVLLHGFGGSGKSYTLKRLAVLLRNKGVRIGYTATTGISAISLATEDMTAKTVHSWAGIGYGDQPPGKLLEKVRGDMNASRRWKETDVLIIDEISMFGGGLLEKLDFVAQNIRKCPQPFGGIRLVLGGDFAQLAPVKDTWIFQTELWKELRLVPFLFTIPKRYTDQVYAGMLSRIRKGTQTQADLDLLATRLGVPLNEGLLAVRPTVLFSRNIDVEATNLIELRKLPGEEEVYVAEDSFVAKRRDTRYEPYAKLIEDAIPKELAFRVGAQVMLRVNAATETGLVNGSRAVVIGMDPLAITVKFVDGRTMRFAQHTWKFEDDDAVVVRRQIPFTLSWATSIHKSQSLSFDYLVCDIGTSIFAPGQAYVALSRVRSLAGLFLTAFYPNKIFPDEIALEYINSLDPLEYLRIDDERMQDVWGKGVEKDIILSIWRRRRGESYIAELPMELVNMLFRYMR